MRDARQRGKHRIEKGPRKPFLLFLSYACFVRRYPVLRGSVTVKVVPSPSALVATMSPPCSRATSRAMASPRP